MTIKSALVKTRVPPDVRARLEAVAADADLSVSAVLRLLINNAVQGQEPMAQPDRPPTKARRKGKVTVRLTADVREALEKEARSQGVTISTWAAALLAARMRQAPQPIQGERRAIQKAYRQLRGLSVNVNQIAYALNRGVLTGSGAELTRKEVLELRSEIAELRQSLSFYAAGRFSFQSTGGEGESRE